MHAALKSWSKYTALLLSLFALNTFRRALEVKVYLKLGVVYDSFVIDMSITCALLLIAAKGVTALVNPTHACVTTFTFLTLSFITLVGDYIPIPGLVLKQT